MIVDNYEVWSLELCIWIEWGKITSGKYIRNKTTQSIENDHKYNYYNSKFNFKITDLMLHWLYFIYFIWYDNVLNIMRVLILILYYACFITFIYDYLL